MKKQTAVEWYSEQLARIGVTEELIGHLTKEAREMEKEQIMNANSCGFSDGINHEKDIPVNFINCEQYYNETFKSE